MFVKHFYLETTIECEKDVQQIDVHRELEKLVLTLLVMGAFHVFLVHQDVLQTFVIQLLLPGSIWEGFVNQSFGFGRYGSKAFLSTQQR